MCVSGLCAFAYVQLSRESPVLKILSIAKSVSFVSRQLSFYRRFLFNFSIGTNHVSYLSLFLLCFYALNIAGNYMCNGRFFSFAGAKVRISEHIAKKMSDFFCFVERKYFRA